MGSFDYRVANADAIASQASRLVGNTLGEIGARFGLETAVRSKAEVGYAIEGFFGIKRNSRSEPDFPGARIELKVVPLRRIGRGLTVKERTVISMIDYEAIVTETWITAKVRSKLNILFVFFEHLREQPKAEFPILDVFLWRPDEEAEALIRADWERVREKVRKGLAHELSESDGRIMGPCTKGPNAGYLRGQPFGSIRAKTRAFALKPPFTFTLFQSSRRPPSRPTPLLVDDPARFEEILLRRFAPFIGRAVDDVADELGVPRSNAKSYAAAVARRVFGASSFKHEIREFAEMGLTPRVTRVGDDGIPFESTSFPAFRYRELLLETWEDSDLLSRVEYMLFLPVEGETRTVAQGRCRFMAPTFWRPSADDLDLIRREWELYRIEIQQGKANHLTQASETVAIHIRPHGRDARDTDDAPGLGPLPRKSFWLNKSFVAEILRGRA